MKFETALLRLKNGKKLTRKGWNGKNMYIQIQHPDPDSKMTQPYIYITTTNGEKVPWIASQSDLLSEDWQIYHEQTPDVTITVITINELKQVIREAIQELNIGQCQHKHGQEHENIDCGGPE